MPERPLRLGLIIGMLTFLAGIALLALTFIIAYGLFQVEPSAALNLSPARPLNVNETLVTLLGLIFRIGMLLVMCIVGSVIANRGIKLFAESGGSFAARTEEPYKVSESRASDEPSQGRVT